MNAGQVQGQGLSKWFTAPEMSSGDELRDGKFYALDDVSFEFPRGCSIVAGANGSGKSVLMSIIAGLEEPSAGILETGGKVGLVFQETDTQILGETPREDVMIGLRNRRLPKIEAINAAEQALRATGILDKAEFPARLLSGGEKRRLAVAGVLALDASIIIFDEPYANLDYNGVLQVNTLAESLLAAEKTVIILTHELEKCLALARYFLVLHKGKAVFAGAPEKGLTLDLPRWGIRNPLHGAPSFRELIWR